MEDELSLDPLQFEYFTSVFSRDPLHQIYPVGFCFVFKKAKEQQETTVSID